MNQNVIRAGITVFGFWWLVLAVYGFFGTAYDLEYLIRASLAVLIMSIAGLLIGSSAVLFNIWSRKTAEKERLRSQTNQGLVCTLGDLPLVSPPPKRSEDLPDLGGQPDVDPEFYAQWIKAYEGTHPRHVELLKALLRVFNNRSKLPATHIPGGHGGRSLLQHSMLVGFYMQKLAKHWTYTGLRSRNGKRVILKLRDDRYKFKPDDPLVLIIGLAHDVGKIEAYIYEDRDPDCETVVGIQHEHDLTGARMLSRMPEVWDLPEEDRAALVAAVAHYHHPMGLPLSSDRRAIDDRTVALMELLIKADFVTSAIEAKGVEPSDEEFEASFGDVSAPVASAAEDEAIFAALSDLLQESKRVNSSEARFNLGTFCPTDGFESPMLLLREDALRNALYARLRIPPETALGDGRYPMTIRVLKLLAQKDLLITEHGEHRFNPENALWNVDFMTRSTKGGKPEKKAGWSAVLVLNPTAFPAVTKMEPYWWFAVIRRPTMGSARAMKGHPKSSVLATQPQEDNLDQEIEDDVAAEAFKRPGRKGDSQGSLPPSTPASAPEQDVPTDAKAEAAGVEAPEPVNSTQPEAQADSQSLNESADQVDSAEEDAPREWRDLYDGIAAVAEAISAGKIDTVNTGTHYVLSVADLHRLAPNVRWADRAEDIIKLVAATGVDVRYAQRDPEDEATVVLALPASIIRAPEGDGSAAGDGPGADADQPQQAWDESVWEAPGSYEPTTLISVHDLKTVLKDLIEKAEAGLLELPREDNRLIISAVRLNWVASHINWPGCRYKITQMIQGQRLVDVADVELVPSARPDSGGFFLKVGPPAS